MRGRGGVQREEANLDGLNFIVERGTNDALTGIAALLALELRNKFVLFLELHLHEMHLPLQVGCACRAPYVFLLRWFCFLRERHLLEFLQDWPLIYLYFVQDLPRTYLPSHLPLPGLPVAVRVLCVYFVAD